MWLTYALLSAVFASLVAILAKLGLKDLDSTLATTLRSSIMAIFLIGLSLVLKKFEGFSLVHLGSREWMLILLSGICGAISWLFYFAALKYGLASKVASVDRLSLVFVVIFATLFLRENLKPLEIGGVILMVIGAILVTN